jgi:hypothetical protein
MQIEVHAPPGALRRSYLEFLERVRVEGGNWVSVPLDDVSGDSIKTKQSVILSAAKNKGLRVQTTVQKGRIYVRYKGDVCR